MSNAVAKNISTVVAERSGDTAFRMAVLLPKAAWRSASRRSPKTGSVFMLLRPCVEKFSHVSCVSQLMRFKQNAPGWKFHRGLEFKSKCR